MVPWTLRERRMPPLKRSNDDLYVRNEIGAAHQESTEWHVPLSARLWPSQRTTYALDHRSRQRGTRPDGRYAEPCDRKGCRQDDGRFAACRSLEAGRWTEAEKRPRRAEDATFEMVPWMAETYIAGEGESHAESV